MIQLQILCDITSKDIIQQTCIYITTITFLPAHTGSPSRRVGPAFSNAVFH